MKLQKASIEMRSVEHIEWPAGDTAARVLGAAPSRRGPVAASLLVALEMLYGAGVTLRNQIFDAGIPRIHRATIPVISVGNLVAGGAGKTPFTRWLAEELASRGRNVAILHGGYASDEPELHRIWHSAHMVFEERDRVRAVADAAAAGADIAVLDDAFQHRRLARDVDIVLLPVETPSNHLLPRGPLREPPSSLARADVIVVTRKTASSEQARSLAHDYQKRTGKLSLVAAILPAGLRNLADRAKAFTGEGIMVSAIARPDLLVRQLKEMGIPITRALAYTDHYEYREKDIQHIMIAADGKPIVTTEKDAVKLRTLVAEDRLWVVEQKVQLEEGRDAFLAILERVL